MKFFSFLCKDKFLLIKSKIKIIYDFSFIKSVRGSDPDAAVYWLARLLDGGEDPKYMARRLFIEG